MQQLDQRELLLLLRYRELQLAYQRLLQSFQQLSSHHLPEPEQRSHGPDLDSDKQDLLYVPELLLEHPRHMARLIRSSFSLHKIAINEDALLHMP